MNGNCHLLMGLSVGTALALNLDKINTVVPQIESNESMVTLFILGGVLGGVFPDIDNPVSYIGKLTKPVSTVISKIGGVFGKTGSHHRGILHDAGLWIICLILSFLYIPSLLGFITGILTHLYLDMFNPAGVPFLGIKRLRLGYIRSGDKSAAVFTWVNVILALIMGLVVKFYPYITRLTS